jgi:hypothetical protein
MTNKYSILDRLPHPVLIPARVAYKCLSALDEVCGEPKRIIYNSMFPSESEITTTRDRQKILEPPLPQATLNDADIFGTQFRWVLKLL